MSGSSWLIDGKRIATKIKTASKSFDPRNFNWKSNPTRACPNCSLIIDNSDVIDEWPGLPKGVKFDPSDQELLWHLLAKIGEGDAKPHPFINEFILTVDKEDGICYTHPQDLPGVKQDGTVTHFFHRTVKAYNTGTRKRRKIQKENDLDMRWHKTGKTKPIILDGVHRGCKKIMVLYMGMTKGEKSEKTNWVMHQYHASPGEDEKEGEFVISKIFYQQLHPKLVEKKDLSLSPEVMNPMAMDHPLTPQPVIDKKDHDYVHECDGAFTTAKLGPVTPKSVSPNSSLDGSKHTNSFADEQPMPVNEEHASQAKVCHSVAVEENVHLQGQELPEENHSFSDLKWFDIDSQILLDSQQLAEGLALCDDILQSQTSCGPDDKGKAPRLSDYAQIGSEHLKRDLEECQKLVMSFDHTDIEIDASSEFRLSQLDFGSQIE